ncbi:hypothetical protein MNB_SM-7-278 [hydrothermal vent metagenome]|uniref:CopG family transcriptional regulator n=1 Tax=hydrothermal vent metagenome TaxID=652676 RepID=A0A1W1BPP5_9ZZZZ
MKLDFMLDPQTIEALLEYSELLKRPADLIIKEALEDYFAKVEKELLEKAMADENAITNLSYEEFWEGVDIE